MSFKPRSSSLAKLAPFSLFTSLVSFYLIAMMVSGERDISSMSSLSIAISFGLIMLSQIVVWRVSQRVKIFAIKTEGRDEFEVILERLSIVSFFVLFAVVTIFYLHSTASANALI